MMREYIFCSVMESPQIARRSPSLRKCLCGLGASSGAKGWKYESAGFGSRFWALAVQQVASANRMSRDFKRIVLSVLKCLHFLVGSQVWRVSAGAAWRTAGGCYDLLGAWLPGTRTGTVKSRHPTAATESPQRGWCLLP